MESFTNSSDPVDAAVGGSIWEMSCQAEEGGLSAGHRKRAGRELVLLPWRRDTPELEETG